jgi:hypothetical protein
VYLYLPPQLQNNIPLRACRVKAKLLAPLVVRPPHLQLYIYIHIYIYIYVYTSIVSSYVCYSWVMVCRASLVTGCDIFV